MNKQSHKRPTVRDVARVAGVSTATVSRALQSPEIVSERTRKAVFDAVSKTGYSVNTAAQMLRRNRSGTVLVILPDIANPFFSKILSGIEEVATRANLTILIGNTNGDDDRFASILENLRNGRADGALLLNGAAPPPELVPDGVPVLSISERLASGAYPHVGTDNALAAYDATSYLISLGHQSITHVTGPAGNSLTADRRDGYRNAMERAGLTHMSAEIDAGFTYQDGREAAQTLLARHPETTAVFCANDTSAMGLVRGLEDAGRTVPADISVMGFDDVPFASIFKPELTTVHQARNKIGMQSMESLLALMNGASPSPVPVFLPHDIVVRNSTRALNR